MLQAEEIYDKNYVTHDDYVRDLGEIVSELLSYCNVGLFLDTLEFFLYLGDMLDEEDSPNGSLTVQDRYFPLFLMLKASPEQDLDNLEMVLSKGAKSRNANNGCDVKSLVLKASGNFGQLNNEEKLALMLYDFILWDEKPGLDIKLGDIAAAKSIFTLVTRNAALGDQLVGGFDDNASFEIFQFFNVEFNREGFHQFCLERWKELSSEWNALKLQLLIEGVRRGFHPATYINNPVLKHYLELYGGDDPKKKSPSSTTRESLSVDEEDDDLTESLEEYLIRTGESDENEEDEDVDLEENEDEDEAELSDKACLFFPINGNTTIVYDEVFEVNEGMIKVKKDDLFGFLDKEGNEIVPCNNFFASDFKDGVSLIATWGEEDEMVFDYINYKKEKYFSLKNFTNGNAPNKYGAWVQKDNTANWEFYDLKGQLIHNVDFENVKNFRDGYSWCIKDKTIFLLSFSGQTQKIITSDDEICIDLDNGLFAISVNKKYGFYKLDGKSVSQFIYDYYVLNLSKGNICVNIGEKWGVINSDGMVVIPCIYDDVEDGNDDLFIVTLDDKKGVVDATGNIIIEIQYDGINGFEDDFAIIELNGLYGIINLKGQEIVSCISSEWPGISKSKLVDIYTENGTNLIDLNTGKPVLKGNYDAILVDGNNLLVSVNDKWGWIDNKENVIIKFKFENMLKFIRNRVVQTTLKMCSLLFAK
jgi:hypothetical protein